MKEIQKECLSGVGINTGKLVLMAITSEGNNYYSQVQFVSDCLKEMGITLDEIKHIREEPYEDGVMSDLEYELAVSKWDAKWSELIDHPVASHTDVKNKLIELNS